jgi:hypothetical protein
MPRVAPLRRQVAFGFTPSTTPAHLRLIDHFPLSIWSWLAVAAAHQTVVVAVVPVDF